MNKIDFYNSLAANYDEMISFDKSVENRKKLLSNFISKDDNVLDFGCGTGVDSISCSLLGAGVSAFDISEDMIEKAKQNAEEKGCDIAFLTKLESVSEIKYDKIISLGNTFANIPIEEVNKIVYLFKDSLKAGGKIILQLVNNSSMPKYGEHILSVKETSNFIIKRHYNFGNKSSVFIISIKDKSTGKVNEISTEIFRYDKKFFSDLFYSLDLKVKFWGSLNRSNYIKTDSKDLVCLVNF